MKIELTTLDIEEIGSILDSNNPYQIRNVLANIHSRAKHAMWLEKVFPAPKTTQEAINQLNRLAVGLEALRSQLKP